jgi:hypothetical protein
MYEFRKYLTLGRTVKTGGGFGRWFRVQLDRFRPRPEMFFGPRMSEEYMSDLKGSGRSLDTRDIGMQSKRALK